VATAWELGMRPHPLEKIFKQIWAKFKPNFVGKFGLILDKLGKIWVNLVRFGKI